MMTKRSAAALGGAVLAATLAANEGTAHAFVSPPPEGSRRTCEHLVCITVRPPAPPPRTFMADIVHLLQEDDNWQREKAEGPTTKECLLGNQGPEVPDRLKQADETTRFEAECFKNAMRGAYDGSIGLVGNACTGVYDRIKNPQRLAEDAALVWSTFDQLAMIAAETILEPDVQARRAVSYCQSEVTSVQQMTPAERRRAAAQFCKAVGELAGGAALTGGIAGAMRVGAASGIFSRFRQTMQATQSIPKPVTPLLHGKRRYHRQGMTSTILEVEETAGADELLAKVMHTQPGQTMDDLLAQAQQGFPDPRYGGPPNCNRGLVEVEWRGFKYNAVGMTKIRGVSLEDSDTIVRTVLRQSHIDDFKQTLARLQADGKAFHDLHPGNMIVSPDGRLYILDNRTIPRPTIPEHLFEYEHQERRMLQQLERTLRRRP